MITLGSLWNNFEKTHTNYGSPPSPALTFKVYSEYGTYVACSFVCCCKCSNKIRVRGRDPERIIAVPGCVDMGGVVWEVVCSSYSIFSFFLFGVGGHRRHYCQTLQTFQTFQTFQTTIPLRSPSTGLHSKIRRPGVWDIEESTSQPEFQSSELMQSTK